MATNGSGLPDRMPKANGNAKSGTPPRRYTPVEGQEPTGRVTATFLRGALAWEDGAVVGPARGRYVARPSGGRRAS